MMSQLTVSRTDSLYKRLRNPSYAIKYLENAVVEEKEEECPGLLVKSLSNVIEANKDLILVPHLLIPLYYIHFSEEDTLSVISVLEKVFEQDKETIIPLIGLLQHNYLFKKKGHHLKQVKVSFKHHITYEDGSKEVLSTFEFVKKLQPEIAEKPDYVEWEKALAA